MPSFFTAWGSYILAGFKEIFEVSVRAEPLLFLHTHEQSLPWQNSESSAPVGWREAGAAARNDGNDVGGDGDGLISPASTQHL